MSAFRTRMKSRLATVLALSLLGGLVATAAQPVVAPAPAAAAGGTTTFTYTGGPQLYLVPDGVTSLTITIKGASGGG